MSNRVLETKLLRAINITPMQGNSVAPPLKLEGKYELKESYICECGQSHFNVGLTSIYNFVSCYKCGEELPDSDSIHWAHSSRFVEE